MFERLHGLELEYDAVEADLADPAVLTDQARLRAASKRYKQLSPVIVTYRRYAAREADLEAARELLRDAIGDERDLLNREVDSAPDDGKDVIVEIRGAEGGEEANLFARDLFQMYEAYATRKGWSIEVLSTDVSDLGGFNQVTFLVRGDDAWSHLKFEGGPHRVQRVPVTESSGRIHTSSATVLVLPEAEEIEVAIDPNDLQVDVYRSSGPGGQGVNTTDSAVRITHKPSGISVAMQDERSQLQNRARAMQVLRARLLKLRQDEHSAVLSAERRSQVGGGGRSEKIRTYNFKENRVTDHRIGLTLYKLQQILAGDLDEVVEGLRADERAKQLAASDA